MKKGKQILLNILLLVGLIISNITVSLAYDFNSQSKALYASYIDELAKNTADNDNLEEQLLKQAAQNSKADDTIMRNIGAKWKAAFADKWQKYIYTVDPTKTNDKATVLADSAIKDSETHAFVCLGFQLKNGEMLPELIGRCETVAAAARQFPKAQIYVSGGATGPNNPSKNTEAGLMKKYLVEKCHIDENRIHEDPRAMTTVENAINTFAMMKKDGIKTATIVTSDYHTRRGTLLYYAEAQLFQQEHNYNCEIVDYLGYKTGKQLENAGHAAYSLKQILGLNMPLLASVENENHVLETNKDFIINLKGNCSSFSKLTVNGQELAKTNYEVKQKNTIIVKNSYLNTLQEGTYQVELFFKGTTLKTSFTIKKAPVVSPVTPVKPTTVKTADNHNLPIYALSLLFSSVLVIYIKRKLSIN